MPAQLGLHVEPGAGVQRRQRLVQQQQGGLAGQRPGQGHSLGLAAGQLAGLAVGQGVEAEPAEPVAGHAPGLLAAGAAGAGPEGHVLRHGQVREQPVVLEHEAHGPPGRLHERAGAGVVDDLPGQLDAAAGHRGKAGQRVQQRGLPGAVGPEHAEHLARRRGERHPEREAAPADLGVHDQPRAQPRAQPGASRVHHPAEPPRSHRSRSETSTTMLTSSSTRLSAMAVSGSVSRA